MPKGVSQTFCRERLALLRYTARNSVVSDAMPIRVLELAITRAWKREAERKEQTLRTVGLEPATLSEREGLRREDPSYQERTRSRARDDLGRASVKSSISTSPMQPGDNFSPPLPR